MGYQLILIVLYLFLTLVCILSYRPSLTLNRALFYLLCVFWLFISSLDLFIHIFLDTIFDVNSIYPLGPVLITIFSSLKELGGIPYTTFWKPLFDLIGPVLIHINNCFIVFVGPQSQKISDLSDVTVDLLVLSAVLFVFISVVLIWISGFTISGAIDDDDKDIVKEDDKVEHLGDVIYWYIKFPVLYILKFFFWFFTACLIAGVFLLFIVQVNDIALVFFSTKLFSVKFIYLCLHLAFFFINLYLTALFYTLVLISFCQVVVATVMRRLAWWRED